MVAGARNQQCRPTCTWWPHEANRVVLLGISLGGVFAPPLAREKPVRGIVVFGTLATRPPAYPGSSERFFTEFDAVDVPAAWAAIDTRLLVLHGQFDENTTEADHTRIAALVNNRHPGAASHREFAGMDHCLTLHESMQKSQGHCGMGEATSALSDAVMDFLQTLC